MNNFQVGNTFGEIRFLGPVDLAGVDVDATIKIRKNTVEVYPDDEGKPEFGQGLNQKAVITIKNAIQEGDEEERKEKAKKYIKKLKKNKDVSNVKNIVAMEHIGIACSVQERR